MSNNERQRRFRQRHPGYNNRYRYRGVGLTGADPATPIDAHTALPSELPAAVAEAAKPDEGWLPSGC